MAPLNTQLFVHGSYGGVSAIISAECTGYGVFTGLDGGKICLFCKKLRAARGSRSPCVALNLWNASLSRCLERREKDVLTSLDINEAECFSSINDRLLSPEGIELKQEAIGQVVYGKFMLTLSNDLPHKTYRSIGEESAPSVDTLFRDTEELYNKNPEFRSSLSVAILKGAVAKTIHGDNVAVEEKLVNFYRFLRTYDKQASQVLSANLNGPSERWLRRLDAKDRQDCFLDEGENGVLVRGRMDEAIARRNDNDKRSVAFSLAIDATKVPPLLEASTGFSAITGGEHPDHLIDISNKTKAEVDDILNGKDKTLGKIKCATEVKMTVMSFQGTPPGVSPFEVVAVRPQSNNESNDFIKEMESLAVAASKSGRGRFANYTVDGVSCESRHVMRTICEFLSGEINHLGATDPNHNMKSWRYQIVAGGGTLGCTIGRYMVDADLLRLAGVSMDLWRPNDFASDLLVLKLVSLKTIEKLDLAEEPFGSTSRGDKGVLSLTLFFIRLHLHAVNGLEVPARHRAVYLWCSMIWLTSLSGASVITKRNVVSEVIPFFFLVLCSDFIKPRAGTSESAEHHFGLIRTMIREFTCLECAQLLERQVRRLRQMYKNKFRPTRDPQKGYQATYNDFFHYSIGVQSWDDGWNCEH